MTLYRVRYLTDGGVSGGFSWHTSRREAVRAFRTGYAVDPEAYGNTYEPDQYVTAVTVTPTKVGLLDVLRRYGAYPDNG